jgi:long-chain acyl-CoA synthetase
VRDGQASIIFGVPRLYTALFEGVATRAERTGRLGHALFQAMFRLSRALRRRLGWRLGKDLLYPFFHYEHISLLTRRLGSVA